MELSQEKKTQIAACHSKGMTVKEIAKAAKLTEAQVDVFLQSIGKRPLYRRYSQTKKDETEKKYNRVTDEQKKEIFELLAQGKGTTEIAQLTGINVKTVNNYKHRKTKKKSLQRLPPSQTRRKQMLLSKIILFLYLKIPQVTQKVKC